MRYWIAFIGSSPFAVINTIWAACREAGYVPDHAVFMINRELNEEWIDIVRHWVPRILEEYGVEDPLLSTHMVEETGFQMICEEYRAHLFDLKANDEVAVDITPGRKYMSAIAMEMGLSMNADHVYYLHLTDNRYHNIPYPIVPLHRHELIDMKKEFCKVGTNRAVLDE